MPAANPATTLGIAGSTPASTSRSVVKFVDTIRTSSPVYINGMFAVFFRDEISQGITQTPQGQAKLFSIVQHLIETPVSNTKANKDEVAKIALN